MAAFDWTRPKFALADRRDRSRLRRGKAQATLLRARVIASALGRQHPLLAFRHAAISPSAAAEFRSSMSAAITLRAVETADLPAFFEHQLDPEAAHLAAFSSRAHDAFMVHWSKLPLMLAGLIEVRKLSRER